MPIDDKGGSSSLLKEIKDTSSRKLTSGVEKVDSLTAEEEEGLDRGGNQALRATKRKIKRWAWYAGFVSVVVLAVGAMVGIFAVGGFYITYVIENDRIADVIGDVIGFLFGVAATLAVEFLWPIGTRKEND